MSKILVTGCSGFIGSRVVRHLLTNPNLDVVCASRSLDCHINKNHFGCEFMSGSRVSKNIFKNVDTVIHAAGQSKIRPWRMGNIINLIDKELGEFRGFADEAAHCGVKKFILLSSIKAAELELRSDWRNKASRRTSYSILKSELETIISTVGRESGMSVVSIRLPPVYGFCGDSPGNLGTLFHLIKSRVPLPLGLISKEFRIIGAQNLVSFVDTCIQHHGPLHECISISDDELYSFDDIVKRYANFCGIRPRVVVLSKNNSVFNFRSAGSKMNDWFYEKNQASDLYGDSLLNRWRAPYSFEECLRMEL